MQKQRILGFDTTQNKTKKQIISNKIKNQININSNKFPNFSYDLPVNYINENSLTKVLKNIKNSTKIINANMIYKIKNEYNILINFYETLILEYSYQISILENQLNNNKTNIRYKKYKIINYKDKIKFYENKKKFYEQKLSAINLLSQNIDKINNNLSVKVNKKINNNNKENKNNPNSPSSTINFFK